jgi:hypothetical protein
VSKHESATPESTVAIHRTPYGLARNGGKIIAEYRAWNGIKSRCYNPRDAGYHRYGGRGIAVCAEWVNDFSAFFAYVGSRPSPKHSIDRYPNNDGNYEKGNVRWATRDQQCKNRRSNHWITLGCKTMTIGDWAKEIGIANGVLRRRLKNHPPEIALTTPNKGTGKHGPRITRSGLDI